MSDEEIEELITQIVNNFGISCDDASYIVKSFENFGKEFMMSEADKMLNDLGYIKYSEDEDKIIYKYDKETFRVSLTFDKRSFKENFYATEGLWIANDDKWYTQKFKNEWDKYNSSQGYWSNIWHEFDMQELQAIITKCKELRWIE